MANNALKWIIKEAKSLKRKFPKRFKKWTQYVAQASSIYASKHKGKSPVGKKRSVKVKRVVKKHTTRRKKIGNYVGGSADQPFLRTGAAVNNILSGVSNHQSRYNEHMINKLKQKNGELIGLDAAITRMKSNLKNHHDKKAARQQIKNYAEYRREIKREISTLKRLIK